MNTTKQKMGSLNYYVGLISQNKFIGRVAEYDPAMARLIDRSLWFVISAAFGYGIEVLGNLVLQDGSFSSFLALTATGVLLMRQTRASKKLRDLENE